MRWILVLLLAGCAQPVRIETVETKVPIMVPCVVKLPEEPKWASRELSGTSDIFTIVKTLWAELEQRAGYEAQVRAASAGCRQEGK